MRDQRSVVRVAAFAIASLCVRPGVAAPADGQLTVDGKTITLRYAYAVAGPDSFDGTKQAFLLLLSEKALAPDAIKNAESFDELGGKSVRSLLQSGIALNIHPDKAFHMTVRHPALKGREIQESGFSTGLTLTALGPDRVAGTFGDGAQRDLMDHTARYKIRFDAPVERRFALEEKLELGPGARKLPAGGGDPGKAWLAEACKPVRPRPNLNDPRAIEKFLTDQGMTEKDLQEEMARQSKLKGHTVTRAEAIKAMGEMMAALANLAEAMALKDCKVLGGSSDGRIAILQVEATQAEVRQRTDVTLVKDGNAWSVKKTGAWRAP